jgi:hypothetical protein
MATDKARELQATSRGRLTRARVQIALTGLMDRVRAVNDTPQDAFKVEVVIVFGSYLSEIPRIGDVDIAVRLKERGRSKEEQKRLEDASYNPAADTWRPFSTEWCGWPRREVMAALKARQPSVDL